MGADQRPTGRPEAVLVEDGEVQRREDLGDVREPGIVTGVPAQKSLECGVTALEVLFREAVHQIQVRQYLLGDGVVLPVSPTLHDVVGDAPYQLPVQGAAGRLRGSRTKK